jgi:ornithine carbamoyltransferase
MTPQTLNATMTERDAMHSKDRLSVKHFVSINDLNRNDIDLIFDTALQIKNELIQNKRYSKVLDQKTMGMVFEKRSTRTRISFETGMTQLGGHSIFLSQDDTHIGKGEPVRDFANVVSGFCDGVMARTFKHETVLELAKHSTIPIINGLTDFNHPCQIMADFLTILEHRGNFDNMKIAWLGDGNNVTHSFMYMCAKLGVDFAIATPEDNQPSWVVWDHINQYKTSNIYWTEDPREAAANADILVTDTWISMGDPEYKDAELRKAKINKFNPYQVNQSLAKLAKDDYYFMHCMPAYRGLEVTSEIIDGHHSLIYPEAHNRLHAQKAIMALLMQDKA